MKAIKIARGTLRFFHGNLRIVSAGIKHREIFLACQRRGQVFLSLPSRSSRGRSGVEARPKRTWSMTGSVSLFSSSSTVKDQRKILDTFSFLSALFCDTVSFFLSRPSNSTVPCSMSVALFLLQLVLFASFFVVASALVPLVLQKNENCH